MTSKKLSPAALEVINNYLRLPFPNRDVSCPYFNNKRNRARAALRVLIGKGTPEEIVEEARIISLRDKIKLAAFDNAGLKSFLVENNLGVDCSGLVFHTLNAECRARGLGPLGRRLCFPLASGLWRRLLSRFRPAENTTVETFAHSANSFDEIQLGEVQAGDFIVFIDTGYEHKLNHILLAHEVEKKADRLLIHYTHSFQWTKDGRYEHGVRQGKIELNDETTSLLAADWTEKEKTGEENETFIHARLARRIQLCRLRIFM